MSYHVTILRTQGGQQKSILLNEVEVAVASMPALKIGPGTHGCSEISSPTDGDKKTLLIWKDGKIWTKNPERETLQIMLDLAKKLNARVRGDEWETYSTPEESYEHPDDLTAIQASRQEVKRFIRTTERKKWFVYCAILGGFVLLGLLVSHFLR